MKKFNIGSKLLFGDYYWSILDIQDNVALIITENIIEQQPYNNYAGDVVWADCSLRRYLNSEFFNKFTSGEQSRIISVINKNCNNQWYESEGGKDTYDHIFLLSIEEVVLKYFGDSRKNLENRSPKQRYWFQKKDINNSKRKSIFNKNIWWWWLRSPGRDNKRATYIHGDGNIGIQGNGTFGYNSNIIHPLTGDNSGGIRPVLWIKLE